MYIHSFSLTHLRLLHSWSPPLQLPICGPPTNTSPWSTVVTKGTNKRGRICCLQNQNGSRNCQQNTAYGSEKYTAFCSFCLYPLTILICNSALALCVRFHYRVLPWFHIHCVLRDPEERANTNIKLWSNVVRTLTLLLSFFPLKIAFLFILLSQMLVPLFLLLKICLPPLSTYTFSYFSPLLTHIFILMRLHYT